MRPGARPARAARRAASVPRRRRREGAVLNAEINVVSLIDVMMLLMVIFMLTAPMMQGGVDVSLPTAQARGRSSPRAASR
jgi:biopolymer transport protein ExbD